MATYHSLGIADKVAGKSSDSQWAFRHLCKKYGVELHLRELSSVFGDCQALLTHSATPQFCRVPTSLSPSV